MEEYKEILDKICNELGQTFFNEIIDISSYGFFSVFKQISEIISEQRSGMVFYSGRAMASNLSSIAINKIIIPGFKFQYHPTLIETIDDKQLDLPWIFDEYPIRYSFSTIKSLNTKYFYPLYFTRTQEDDLTVIGMDNNEEIDFKVHSVTFNNVFYFKTKEDMFVFKLKNF